MQRRALLPIGPRGGLGLTLVIILRTNKSLLHPGLDQTSTETATLPIRARRPSRTKRANVCAVAGMRARS